MEGLKHQLHSEGAMTAINLTIDSKAGGKLFRFDTARARKATIVNGRTGAAITDQLLIDEMSATVQALYDGTTTYDYAQSFFSEMHRRGLIVDTDLRMFALSTVRKG
jgi:hypothetical protein